MLWRYLPDMCHNVVWNIISLPRYFYDIVSPTASLVTASRMQKCFNVFTDMYNVFLLVYHCCISLGIKPNLLLLFLLLLLLPLLHLPLQLPLPLLAEYENFSRIVRYKMRRYVLRSPLSISVEVWENILRSREHEACKEKNNQHQHQMPQIYKCESYEECSNRSGHQGQGQVITSSSICEIRLLVPTLDTCFWHKAPDVEGTAHTERYACCLHLLNCFCCRCTC